MLCNYLILQCTKYTHVASFEFLDSLYCGVENLGFPVDRVYSSYTVFGNRPRPQDVVFLLLALITLTPTFSRYNYYTVAYKSYKQKHECQSRYNT